MLRKPQEDLPSNIKEEHGMMVCFICVLFVLSVDVPDKKIMCLICERHTSILFIAHAHILRTGDGFGMWNAGQQI